MNEWECVVCPGMKRPSDVGVHLQPSRSFARTELDPKTVKPHRIQVVVSGARRVRRMGDRIDLIGPVDGGGQIDYALRSTRSALAKLVERGSPDPGRER